MNSAGNVTFADNAIFHSDRGSNYTSTSFSAALALMLGMFSFTGMFMLARPAIAATAAPDLTLRYDRPATDNADGWEREALPVGNGRIGAMVFGQPAREHLTQVTVAQGFAIAKRTVGQCLGT